MTTLELTKMFVHGVTATTMFAIIGRPGLPGQPLIEAYFRISNRELPGGLELGGLYMAFFWWAHNVAGIPMAYLLGFRLAPLWMPLSFGAQWGITVICFFSWTWLWFELGYWSALREALKSGYRPPRHRS
ncbi:MAG: hypothetical protein RMI89_10880 [Gloeomargarita sp. SKYBB_i_bin120]|nr:hypothetical protein [Gloeomargarita sp. SKYB120]MDW8179020.1 hypothetical protein [Gloeomargarita sp. SKYBB_i_bin120]